MFFLVVSSPRALYVAPNSDTHSHWVEWGGCADYTTCHTCRLAGTVMSGLVDTIALLRLTTHSARC
ncbi:hypothetical protein E2C01_058931 [Portunus trituberculatus]|uniref:Uncharacterized protein n=1 Tax=Portunus trituberculatus TaxID=210409 RepID=A0A5B7GXP4_PORTR|nr:hypothetical protein [Portunus trituberculatus]